MLVVSSEFEKIKNIREYKNSIFKNINTNEEFEEFLQERLKTDNIINYITAIARVENFINGKNLNEGIEISTEKLIQKINISKNREKLLKWVEESNKREDIKRLVDIDREKLRIIEELEKVLKVLAPNYSDKIILKEYRENSSYSNDNEEKQDNKTILKLVVSLLIVVLIFVVLYYKMANTDTEEVTNNSNNKKEINISKIDQDLEKEIKEENGTKTTNN